MNRKLRITFRNGDVRMIGGIGDRSLLEIVTIFRRDGWFMGDVWCAPCTSENVAMIEVVETAGAANERSDEQGKPYPPRELQGLAASLSGGIFKPPGEA